uniref:Serine aminopeptidase S33 domain-containing protein n=1 Tax=Aplanochytrium stocchinoi TaxID=215587 RepID=A0A7S3LJ67_9STRA|mmetsp:Transcript_20127/g.24404  ORF Transcript_20127/g.24404 Transcript_20127/m.24404 type:complete len:361 (-) Transcript_20127:137-1219(-)|eukprot:CAMPEP_0204837944 /NCGR_PEP_ID=MMETSP1346-20131115/29333_1 /ASSEMBLY_ACC=CAM_ASM_000771 /TAXON_ID=215587 /ORGANISM="Aplanochytrium stocchinoi, Strain GSBS06" /LENGTH=360 /DNA_ID=CAMNT_0051973677 /DNA_START=246 /DNA_END=1328 /DNA_ORIENTATION=-
MFLSSVDKVYATDEESAKRLHDAAKHLNYNLDTAESQVVTLTSEVLDKVTSIGEACSGNNPYNTVANVVEGFVDLENSQKRRVRLWLPEAGIDVKATILLIHGYGEHSGRYHHVAEALSKAGYQMLGYDHKYHGDDENSVGSYKITQIKSFDELVNDAQAFVSFIERKYPDVPYFLMGHSMGGLISVLVSLNLQDSWNAKGMILSGPAIRVAGNVISPYPYTCFFSALTRLISFVIPYFPAPGAPNRHISRNETVRKASREDPKMIGEYVTARFAEHFVYGGSIKAQRGLDKIKTPFFIVYGTSDKIVDPKGAMMLFDKAPSDDKDIKAFVGAFHEVFTDPVYREEVLSDFRNWLDAKVS